MIASGTATSKYNKPADATYTLTVNAADLTLGAPVFTPAAGEYKSGQVITATAANAALITYTTDGSTPDFNSTTFPAEGIILTADMTLKAIAFDNDVNSSTVTTAVYTVKQSVEYEKLTSTSDLAAGDKLIIAYEDTETNYAMGTLDGSVHKGISGVTISNNIFEDPDETVAILTLGGATGAWTLQSSITSNYLSINSDGNRLDESSSVGTDAQKWSISYSNSKMTIFNNSFTAREIQYNYNSGNPRFAAYKSTQKAIALYRLKENLADNAITLSPSTAQSLNYGGTVVVTATATNSGTITAESSDEAIATASDNGDGTFTITAVSGSAEGSDVVITFSTPKTSNHKAATQTLTVTVTDSRTDAPISFADAAVSVNTTEANSYTGQPLTNSEGLTVSYDSDNSSVATVADDGTVTLTGTEGTATISATFAGNSSYKATTVSYTVTVYEPVVFTAFFESFDNCATGKEGGNDGKWSGVSTSGQITYENTGWAATNMNPADRCLRGGTSNKQGSITTPALKLDPADTYVLTFKAGAWKDASTTMTLTSTDGVFAGETSTTVTMADQNWTGYYVELTAGAATTTVTFSSTERFFIDEVRVMEKSAYEALAPSKTVESYGWATYIPDYNVTFAAGDAYVVTAASVSDGLTVEAVTSVPAKTPVLLKGAGAKTITVSKAASVTAPETNLLTVCDGTIASGKYPYVLAKNGEGACFKQWTGDISTLSGRAVLALDEAVAGSRAIFTLDDEATGISSMHNSQSTAHNEVYNLNGQRVNQPQKGLYIVNGKKVLVK